VRIYLSKWFARFMRKEGIPLVSLRKAVSEANAGRIDADYGGGVIKQRIARPNEGKSGGYRTILLFQQGERAFFVYGFAKNAQANISASDEHEFKILAKTLLNASPESIGALVENGKFLEITCHEQTADLPE